MEPPPPRSAAHNFIRERDEIGALLNEIIALVEKSDDEDAP